MRPLRLLALLLPATSFLAVGTPAMAAPAQAPGGARAAAERAHLAFEQRMVARRTVHVAVAARPLAGESAAGGFDTITGVRQVSRDTLGSFAGAEPDTQTEPDIAIDPNDPNVIVSTFQQGRYQDGGSVDPGYATSQDGGRTWAAGNLPLLTKAVGGPFDRASDAAAAVGPDGSVYLQTIPFDQNDPRSAVAVQRSDDGGLSFGPPVLVVDDNDINIFHDKNWITVDNSARSPHRGRIYSVWSKFVTTGEVTHSPGIVSYSDDRGAHWSPQITITAPDADTEGLLPLVGRDGSLTVVYDLFVDNARDFETAQTSHDGGLTWSAPVTVGEFLGAGVPGIRTGGLPAAAIDPTTGNMYVTWQDTRFNPDGLNDIVLSASRNGGRTWSAPAQINPRVAGLDRFTPDVAAAAGAVHLTYRTRGANGTASTVDENYIASTDNGKTFGFEHTVGPPSPIQWAAQAGQAAFYGDYMGVAATPRHAALVWNVSARPPVPGQTFHQTTWTAIASR
jgi:hypothetical protein